MEILRTSRTNLMATGIVIDPDGSRHPVTYSTDAQSEQMVSIVSPELMTLVLEPASALAGPGQWAVGCMSAHGARRLTGSVRVELVCPRHIQGVSAEPVTIESADRPADLRVRFADGSLGHSTCRSPFGPPASTRAAIP